MICPSCGGDVPEDTVWTFRQKFYCCEKCVRKAMPWLQV